MGGNRLSDILLLLVLASSIGAASERAVRVEKVIETRVPYFITTHAFIEANVATVLSFRVSGQIRQLHVDVGASVNAGALVASLVSDVAQKSLARTEVLLSKAGIEKSFSLTNLARIEALFRKNQIAKEAYLAAKHRTEIAAAEYELLQVEYAVRKIGKEHHSLRSPVDGTVVQRFREEAEYVRQGEPVLTILANLPPKLRGFMPIGLAPHFNVGMKIRIGTNGSSMRDSATLTAIAPIVNESNQGVQFEALIDSPSREVYLPNSIASVHLESSSSKALTLIPKDSILGDENGNPFCFVLDKEGKQSIARTRDLVLGGLFGKYIEIADGIAAGESVIVDGHHHLFPEQAIKVIK